MPSVGFTRPVGFGSVFHEATGKLYLFRPDTHIQVIKAWPRPQAWILTPKSAWKGCHPPFRLPAGGSLTDELARIEEELRPSGVPGLAVANLPDLLLHHANLRLANTIPEHVRSAISGFPSEHWHLLRLAAAGGGPALDLMRGTPALAVALASARRFRFIARPLRAARSLLARGKSLAGIAHWLGFPGTKAAIRMLRKVAPEGLNSAVLRHVRTILIDPRIHHRAAHLPILSRPCIRVLSDPLLEGAVDQAFLHALAEETSLEGVWRLKDILDMHTMLEAAGTPFPRLGRVADLERLHDEMVDRLNDQDFGDAILPPPPAPGTECILPIQTTAELQKEGRTMHHCVASLLPKIMNGHSAVYRVLAPERCTMSLRWVPGPQPEWVIDQVKLARNKEPAKGTLWTLKTWLADTPFQTTLGRQGSHHGIESHWEDDLPF